MSLLFIYDKLYTFRERDRYLETLEDKTKTVLVAKQHRKQMVKIYTHDFRKIKKRKKPLRSIKICFVRHF